MSSQSFIVFFRVDAYPQIGAGHMMRCLALAQGFKQAGIRSYFLVNSRTSELLPSLANFEFDYYVLHHAETEIAELNSCIESFASMYESLAIILDGYQFCADYRFQLKALGISLVVLDDQNNSGELHADLVLNPLENAYKLNYRGTAPAAWHLFGHQYVLLQPAFQNIVPSKIVDRDSLLVTFGASDVKDLTRAIAGELVQGSYPFEQITLITGAAYPYLGSLLQLLAAPTEPKTGIQHLHAVADMTQPMQQARLAISAAGSTQFELACLHVPSLLVVVADNQLAAAKEQEVLGWCQVVDARQGIDAHTLLEKASGLWQDQAQLVQMSRAAQHVNYKNGVQRIVRAIRQRFEQEVFHQGLKAYGVVIRSVQEADLEMIRLWRNDPYIQQFMLDQTHISSEQQLAWFGRIRNEVSQAYFVIYFKEQAIGVVNIKSTDSGPMFQAEAIEIGLYIYESRYRSNLLAFCPSLAIIDFCFDRLQCARIVASVLPANQAAINYNRQLGYTMHAQTQADDALVHMQLEQAAYLDATHKIKSLIRY